MVILVPHNCVGSVENSNMDDPDTQTQDHCKYTEMSDFSRICFVSQVLLFLVALVSLTIGLTFGYKLQRVNDAQPSYTKLKFWDFEC